MKKWFLSKTLWANFLAFIGIAIQEITGTDILPMELQIQIITIANIVLRFLTKTEIS
jgi:hypothetical protein